MADDDLQITSDLTARFTQLGEIKTVADRLRNRLGTIAEDNHTAGGIDDEYAQQYHQNVDEATKNLTDLVDGIGGLFDTTGANGKQTADNQQRIDEESTATVRKM